MKAELKGNEDDARCCPKDVVIVIRRWRVAVLMRGETGYDVKMQMTGWRTPYSKGKRKKKKGVIPVEEAKGWAKDHDSWPGSKRV